MLALSLQLPAQAISEISALATAALALVTVTTAAVGFWNRSKLWNLIGPWIADRAEMKRRYDEAMKAIDGLRADVGHITFTCQQQKDAIEAQATTIKSLRGEVADLRVIKKRFDALLNWLPAVFEYIGYLKSLASVGKDTRQMPVLPLELRDHIEIPDEVVDGSS